jgi:hypothetical protein
MKKNSNTNSTQSTSKIDDPFGVKVIRLLSGEDLIGSILEDEDSFIITEPLHMIFKRTEVGSIMVLLPWLPVEFIEENKAIISKNNVLTIIEPKDKLIKYYDENIQVLKEKLEKMEMDQNKIMSYDESENDDSFDTEDQIINVETSNKLLH